MPVEAHDCSCVRQHECPVSEISADAYAITKTKLTINTCLAIAMRAHRADQSPSPSLHHDQATQSRAALPHKHTSTR